MAGFAITFYIFTILQIPYNEHIISTIRNVGG